MSYYNSPGLHVQHMGASHGITVSIHGAGSSALLLMVVATGPPWEPTLMSSDIYLSSSFLPSVHLKLLETSQQFDAAFWC